MIHVVQTDGPHAEFPHPAAPPEEKAWWWNECSCGRRAIFYIEDRQRTYCAWCGVSLAIRNRLLPIEAKRVTTPNP